MVKRVLTAAMFASLLVVVGCKETPKETQVGKSTYELKEIEAVDFTTTSRYSASVRGKQDIEIYPQVGGYLSRICVTEGESVQAGETLFVIEQAPFMAAYQAAKAAVAVAESQVANAQLDYDNAAALKAKAIISQSELNATQNRLKSAQAQLTLAKAQQMSAKTNLDFTVIKSPSNGVVGKLPYRQGALVSAALPVSLTTISDNSEMYVYFSMGENQVLNLLDTYGSLDSLVTALPAVELVLNNGTAYAHLGTIESVSGVIDSNTGTVSLRAVFPNEERRLLSGGSGSIVLKEQHAQVITIPKAATYELQDRFFVYKVVDGKAVSTQVTLDKQYTDAEYIVREGLSVGDRIIASGAGLVVNGAPVNQ